MIMTTQPETATKSQSELQQTSPPTLTDELSEVNRAAQALVDALKELAQVKIQSATDLTEETHQGIDRSVQILRDKADRSWRNASDLVEDIDDRVTKAAKAAWEILTSPPIDS
jgi:transcription initiation factor IIF auxiliary subunit